MLSSPGFLQECVSLEIICLTNTAPKNIKNSLESVMEEQEANCLALGSLHKFSQEEVSEV